jgi:hypothetical protein
MKTRRGIAGSVIAGLFCWACANTALSTSEMETRSEAGTHDARLSPDTGAPEPTQDSFNRESGSGIETRNDAGARDASLSPDTGTPEPAQDASDREDAFDSGISWTDKTGIRGHDALVPPFFCIAPCTWRIAVACMPPRLGACQLRKSGGPGTTEINSVIVCDPISGWFRAEGEFSSAGLAIAVGNTTGVCFGTNGGGKSPSFMPWVSDGKCPISGGNGSSASVHCLDDGKDYILEPSRPECALWVRESNPYCLTPAFECESITEGPCDSVPNNIFGWRFTAC